MTADDLEEKPNPPRRGLRKGLYLIPSAFTAANIGMGFFSVMSSLRGFQLLGAVMVLNHCRVNLLPLANDNYSMRQFCIHR